MRVAKCAAKIVDCAGLFAIVAETGRDLLYDATSVRGDLAVVSHENMARV
jgi:hypothetical protein